MGTPNSTISEQALRDHLLEGTTPDISTLCALGLDVELLKDRHEAIKPQLPYLHGYTPLEDACAHYIREYTKTWKDLVIEAKLAGTRAIRFAAAGAFESPLLSLSPIGTGGSLCVEVFLARNGDWIVWNDYDGHTPQTPSYFTRHQTVESAISWLYQIEGDEHEYASYHYDGLHYWPLPGHATNNGRKQECAIALVLAKHLGTIREASIAAKESRLHTQTALRDMFNKTDVRYGLNI